MIFLQFASMVISGVGGCYFFTDGNVFFGITLILFSIFSAIFFGTYIGEKRGKTIDFNQVPENTDYIFEGFVEITNPTMIVALVRKANDSTGQDEGKPLKVIRNFPVQLRRDAHFTRKGNKVFEGTRC